MEHDPHNVLDLLRIPRTSPVRVEFFDLLGRANVIFDAALPMPPPETLRSANCASRWDIDVFTAPEYDRVKRNAIDVFTSISNIDATLAQKLIAAGFMTLGDLSILDPEILASLSGFDPATVDEIGWEVDRRCLEEHDADPMW